MTNRQAVKDALLAYLGGDGPGKVACLSGTWGCGKTHLWAELASDLGKKEKRTAYVSLFGVTGVGDAKTAVFNSAVLEPLTDDGQTKRMLAKTGEFIARLVPGAFKAIDSRIGFEVLTKNIDLTRMIPAGTIVCLDDLERVSDQFPLEDALGFANLLAERRECRVLLIMNEDHLDQRFSEDQASIVRAYRERVVRRFLKMDADVPAVLPFIISANQIQVSKAAGEVVVQALVRAANSNIRTLIRSVESAALLESAVPGVADPSDTALLTALTSEHALGTLREESFYDFHPVIFAIGRRERTKDELLEAREAFFTKYFHDAYQFNSFVYRLIQDGYLDSDGYRSQLEEKAGRSLTRVGRLMRRINERDFQFLSDAEATEWMRESIAALTEGTNVGAAAVNQVFSVAAVVARRAGQQVDPALATAAENALIDAARRLDRSLERGDRFPGDSLLPDLVQQQYDSELASATVAFHKDALLKAIFDLDGSAFARIVQSAAPGSAEAVLDRAILIELHATMARNRRFWCHAIEVVGVVLGYSPSSQPYKDDLRTYLALVCASAPMDRSDVERAQQLYKDIAVA